MTTQRLNVDVPVDQHRDFHLFAVSQGTSMSDLVRRMVADEPMIERLRRVVADLNSGHDMADVEWASAYPTVHGPVWEYRLPSGRTAKVAKTPSGSFLTY